jgi:translocation and assembly module TamB
MPVRAAVRLAGQWGPERAGAPDGWRGTLSTLSVEVGDLGARLQAPVTASFMPSVSGDAPQWQVGTVDIQVLLPMKKSFVLRNQLARGGQGWWETRGGIDRLALSPRLIQALHQRFAPAEPESDNGGVHLPGAQQKLDQELVLAADWNLKFKGALTGQAHLRRVSGDMFVPGDPGFLLGLRTLDLGVTARPRGGAASQIAATLDVATEKKGRISAQGSAVLHTAGKAAWTLDTGVPQSVKVNADIADLAWLDVFLGDQTELGGSLRADISASSGARGAWQTSGTLRGQDIKFLRIDDGVRLFNGTLAAHLQGSKVVLDSLKFPSVLRVAPKEWRTAEWVKTSPDAKDGSLTVTGEWDLFASTGKINAKLYRYPILQRSDRYAMLTGGVTVDARLPSISVTGDVKADAGWFDLDVLGSVPTVDSDVVVIRPGQQQVARVPSDISLDLKVDLGSRFYLTGYGVNSGLVGSLHVLLNDNKLTGVGELRTRGGSIDVYGQHLQLRRGTVTFQGNIANPVLSIEALRTDVAVRAGVRVTGTAKKPKIDLVSYPDVSEVEKLSWLLLGRAPDEGGGDVALLFTVGSSLVGGGEPFYRKLGLDELSIRTGELGSTGSVLPPDSVVSSANQGPSQLEQQFAQAGKHLSDGVTLSLEQALASTGTVGRLSYKLSRRLRAQLSVGTVNGVALVYHVFFDV